MQSTASAAAGAASSTQRQLVDLSLTLGGVQYEKRNRLTDERRIQLPPDWARQLQVDTIEVQGRDGVYVGNYFGGGGLCSLATFDEMERELGWDEIDVKKIPKFGTPRNPVCLSEWHVQQESNVKRVHCNTCSMYGWAWCFRLPCCEGAVSKGGLPTACAPLLWPATWHSTP